MKIQKQWIVSYSNGTDTKIHWVCDPEYSYKAAKKLAKIKSNSGMNETYIDMRIITDIPVRSTKRCSSFMWNPGNRVVQSHVDGTIDEYETNIHRARIGLPPFKYPYE